MPSIMVKETGRTLEHEAMLAVIRDMTGGCPAKPANSDVIQMVVRKQVATVEALRHLSFMVVDTINTLGPEPLTEPYCARVLYSMLEDRDVRARMIRHACRYHKISRRQAVTDVGELHQDCREILVRAGEPGVMQSES